MGKTCQKANLLKVANFAFKKGNLSARALDDVQRFAKAADKNKDKEITQAEHDSYFEVKAFDYLAEAKFFIKKVLDLSTCDPKKMLVEKK